MLNVSRFACPDRQDFHVYDFGKLKPCIGLCGHTACLACIKECPSMCCPTCDKENAFKRIKPNSDTIEMMKHYRENYWKMFTNFWRCEGPIQGECSECGQMDHLWICIDSEQSIDLIRLELENTWEFQESSDNVLCERCAIESCFDNGKKPIRIDEINLAKEDIRLATAISMQQLFMKNLKDMPGLMDCTLRKMNLDSCYKLMHEWLDELNKTNLKVEERVCGHLAWVIILEIIEKLIKEIDLRVLELQNKKDIECECTRLYEKLEQSGTTVNFKEIFENISITDDYTPGCPFFFQENAEENLKLYSIINEMPTHSVVLPSPDNKNCLLCIFVAYEKNQDNLTHSNDWLNLIENLWNNEMPSLKACCYQCLEFLIGRKVGKQCRDCKNMDGIERDYHDYWSSRKYPEKKRDGVETDCIVNETKFWKYDIIFEIRHGIRKIMENGIANAKTYCKLRKMRMMNTMHRLLSYLEKIDLKMCSEKTLMENIDQVSEFMSSLRFQWDTYITESGEQPTECMCTAPMKYLERTVNVLKETKNEKLESYTKLQSELALRTDYFLTKCIKGCPVNFTLPSDQQFSNPTSVKQFFSDYVSVFCSDDKLLMDSFHIMNNE